jgi:hypothetical protein
MDMQYLELISKSLVSGLLSAYLLIYGLRPAVPYPDIILEFFENKLLFLLLLIVNYYVYVWDYNNGSLLLLCVIALIFDYVVFAGDDELKETSKKMKDDMETFFTAKTTGNPETFDEMLIKQIKEKIGQYMFTRAAGVEKAAKAAEAMSVKESNEPAPFIA